MTDFSKNPVEEKLLAHMQRNGALMDELATVSVKSKDDLDRLANMFGISPSTYQGQEQAAVIFVKGVVVYGLMDKQEKYNFLETLHRVWGNGSRFTGAVTNAVADRVAGIQNGMNWEDLPNVEFVKEYAAIIYTARMIGVATDGLEYGGAALTVGQVGNAVVKSRTGVELIDTAKLAEGLTKLGLNGTKVLRSSGWIGAGVGLTSFAVQKLVERSLDQAKNEAQKRLDKKAKNYEMSEDFFDAELKKYDLIRDKAAVK